MWRNTSIVNTWRGSDQYSMSRSFIIAFLLTIISCNSSSSLSEKDKKDIAAAVEQTLTDYYKDIREKGLLAEIMYLDSTADFSWTPPGFTKELPYDTIMDMIWQNAGKFPLVDNSFDSLHIEPLTKTNASYTAVIRSVMTDTSGKKDTFFLKESGILIKRENGWKLLSGKTTIVNN